MVSSPPLPRTRAKSCVLTVSNGKGRLYDTPIAFEARNEKAGTTIRLSGRADALAELTRQLEAVAEPAGAAAAIVRHVQAGLEPGVEDDRIRRTSEALARVVHHDLGDRDLRRSLFHVRVVGCGRRSVPDYIAERRAWM